GASAPLRFSPRRNEIHAKRMHGAASEALWKPTAQFPAVKDQATGAAVSVTLVMLTSRLILLNIHIVAMDFLPARAGLAAFKFVSVRSAAWPHRRPGCYVTAGSKRETQHAYQFVCVRGGGCRGPAGRGGRSGFGADPGTVLQGQDHRFRHRV